ncbi:MAG: HesA/MoeB/ThiF family protein [Deltaproteobacteria bacterium]|nr:HesA/MoeB/ThiF family protein [Deltaproteobacteria bacterium]
MGQARLAAARVLVVGCGGLGAPVISGLAAAGVGHLTLVDDDTVEPSNLNRQVLFTEADVGRPKAEVAAERARGLSGALDVRARAERLAAGGARAAVRGFSLVVDCTDGLPSKFLLNDACVREDVPLVHGAATAWSGQVLVVPGRKGPCLRCLFEGPLPAGALPTCRTAGILGAVTGVIGSFQTAEAVKVLVGNAHALYGRLLAVDVLAPSVRAVAFPRRADCPACGEAPTVDGTNPADYDVAVCDD